MKKWEGSGGEERKENVQAHIHTKSNFYSSGETTADETLTGIHPPNKNNNLETYAIAVSHTTQKDINGCNAR